MHLPRCLCFDPYSLPFGSAASEKGIAFTNILVIDPEGLPLAVTLALAFTTKPMTAETLFVRIPGSIGIQPQG